ncbi:cytosolic phospholipase A2 epsilon-like [Natator depressus]|uniref:cytosolic phospholipase A2 epsilon-like n=1 Tax=Natator depressus TaxID=27790 RepID=UPI003EB8D151
MSESKKARDEHEDRSQDAMLRLLEDQTDILWRTVEVQEDLDMLLGSDLCAEEQDFLQKRKKVVAATLKKVLQLEEDLLDLECKDCTPSSGITAGCAGHSTQVPSLSADLYATGTVMGSNSSSNQAQFGESLQMMAELVRQRAARIDLVNKLDKKKSLVITIKQPPVLDYNQFMLIILVQKEVTSINFLHVKIIRMRNLRKADLLSQSDCYVELWLPTASTQRVRTKTIKNCKNPIWNETFRYRIDSRVKNMLELKVCDEDRFSKDDELCTVLFDIAKLQVGYKVRVKFVLNPQEQEELEVEFILQNILDCPENIITNGVLVSREVSCLEVNGQGKKLKQQSTKEELTLTVKGSYEETQKISLDADSSLGNRDSIVFHYVKNKQTQLDVTLPKKMHYCVTSDKEESLPLPLNSLPLQKKITIARDKTFDLHVKAKDCLCFRPKDMDVRFGFDLCTEEQVFLCKRKKYVAATVKKVLQLEEDLQDHEVPVVAITTTGGGTRSLTAMYGSLLGLQKLNILDSISYITGLSGTTWTMANLYEDANWSQKYLEEAINKARKHVTKCKIKGFTLDRLKYYYNELKERCQQGYNTSFIDLWGLMVEYMLHDEKDNHKLSDQQQAMSEGQNPLPIYMAINLKNSYSAQDFREWLEFTPYEVGFWKYGAFIRSQDFGSEFFMGRLMKKFPESRICFMEGMWSGIFSFDVMYFWNLAFDSEDFWYRWTRDRVNDIEEDPVLHIRPHETATRLSTPAGALSTAFRDVLTGRPTIAEFPNFLRGFQFHNEYLENEHFSTWKDTVIDTCSNKLIETAQHPLSLADTGFFINTSYPPLLVPQRKVDVILHLNYSGGSQTLPLDLIEKYCSEQGIPFPRIEMSEEDRKNPKECYLFEDAESPRAPLVLFFPLVNDTFKKYKAPGVERSPTEMEEGKVDVSSPLSPYTTKELSFSEENFDNLVKMTDYNILNNENLIVQALRTAVERRKQQAPKYYKGALIQ